MPANPNSDPSDARFFNKLPAYVALFSDGDDAFRVASEITEHGPVVLTFASLFDIVVELTYRLRLGGTYIYESASELDPELFRAKGGTGFITDVRLGWPARDGQILLRRNGAFAGCSRLMWHPEPDGLAFEFDTNILDEYSRLREMAGLYAWQETDAEIRRTWSERRVLALAERAVKLVEVIGGSRTDWNQLAFFDPEFEQWHFVPHP